MAHNAAKNYSSMRGLNKFINKIKDCPTKDAEKEAVRNELYKFSIVFQKANNVGSYQRKKYVCKLLYIFMMGYKLDNFGYREAIKLCSASKFSEKQMGYLAVGVLIDENHEALPLLIETIKTDLQSPTFEVQALAVGAIANIGGRTLAKEFSETIINLLMSNQSSIQLKKKSSLCLLRIFKKYPDIVTPEFLSLKITGLLSIYHLGLLTSVMSLLLGMADMAIDISQCQCFLPRVVEILDQMVFNVGQQGHASYDYCGISNPWLQIKLLRFMQFFPITDASLHATLLKITSKILNQPRDPANDGENHKSARNAILMECYSLVATLDSPAELSKTVELLVNGFTSSTSSPNIVLLSLSKLASICFKNPNAKYLAAQHYATVHALLSSKDAEIKLKAFQLFLSIRTNENTNQIVQDMLKIIASEDPILEFPMIENVASLSESVSQTNPAWYVEVFTRLLSVSGNKVAENMWSSLISNITANPQLQPFAAKLYVQFLSEQLKACEPLVVVGAIILRKFGAEIANEPGFGFSQQYKVLSSQTEVKSARGLEELQLTLESLKNYPQDDSSVSHNVSSDVQSQFGQSQLLPTVQNPAEDEAFKTLCVTKQGVLLQTEQLQVGIMITPNQSSLGLAVFYGNLSNGPLTDLSIGVINPEDNAIKFDAQAWAPTIEAQQQVPHSITVTALKDFSVTPKLALSFRTASGLLVSSEMLLPIIIPSFCTPLVAGTQEFLGLWGLFPAPPCEQQVTWTTVKGIDRARAMQAAIGLNFHMVDGVDPSPGNFVSATTFHTVNAQTNVLCRLESDENHKMFRVTVRSPVPSISSSVANILKQYIN